MLGLGAIGQFAIGEQTLGAGGGGAEFIGPDKYMQAFGEPVRFKPGLSAYLQQALALFPTPVVSFSWFESLSEPVRNAPRSPAAIYPNFFMQPMPSPFVETGWFSPLSEPVRFKPALSVPLQSFFAYQSNPITVTPFSWFAPLSEPKRFRPSLPESRQPFLFYQSNPITVTPFSWFAGLSIPVRTKPGLLPALQREISYRNTFVPTIFSARLQATEQGDFLNAVLRAFNIPVRAYVDIIANDPTHLGNTSVIGNVPQSSVVSAIIEPQSIPATGTPVSTVAGARVAIIRL